jgi:hypothetical protein
MIPGLGRARHTLSMPVFGISKSCVTSNKSHKPSINTTINRSSSHQSKTMVRLCVQIGADTIEVESEDVGSAYQLKKAVKSEKQNYYRNTDADQIVIRDYHGNELANLADIADLIAAGHGGRDRPFLVDALAGMYASSNFLFCPTLS